jgi:class 3 adenylate cyclase
MEIEAGEVTGVALLFDDLTGEKLKRDALLAEQTRIEGMLLRVIPEEVLKQLEDGAEAVSFAVQSASIGFVQVNPAAEFANMEFDDQLAFYNRVFQRFDTALAGFRLLAKVRTVGNVYIFAGGLFGIVNKPEKHAEEAVRFALKLIQDVQEGRGEAFELMIGMNTGGPLVAGVAALEKPTFQLIGPPFEIAEELMRAGISMQIHITRSVYELVYAHNFHVTERGEVKIGGGRTLPTYVIEL